MHCPNCNHTLNAPIGGRRLSCSLCGWVQPTELETPPEQEPLSRKAEEIARERQLNTGPAWRYVFLPLGGLALLLVGLNTIVSAYHKERPQPGASSEAQMPPAETPSPGPTEMPPSSSSPMPGTLSSTVAGSTPLPAANGSQLGSASPGNPQDVSKASGSPQASGNPVVSPQVSGSPLASGSPGATPSPGASASSAFGTPSMTPASSIPVSSLPTLVPPSSALITPPPLSPSPGNH